MKETEPLYDRLWSRIRNNPLLAGLMVLGTIIIALSAFTDAAKNLANLIAEDKRLGINGTWTAEVRYSGRNTRYVEHFRFEGNNDEVHGEASYLNKNQIIVNGNLKQDRIEFETRTTEYSPDWANDTTRLATHRYSGRIRGDEIDFVMETSGGFSNSPPISFSAVKAADRAD